MVAGYFLSPPVELDSHWALLDRGMDAGVLWLLAGVVYQVNRAEAKRQGAAARLQLQTAALEATANAMVITDLAGAISWVNPAFTRSTGYPVNIVALCRFRQLHPPFFNSSGHPYCPSDIT